MVFSFVISFSTVQAHEIAALHDQLLGGVVCDDMLVLPVVYISKLSYISKLLNRYVSIWLKGLLWLHSHT